MTKPPRTRHSGKPREPVTIDLEAVRDTESLRTDDGKAKPDHNETLEMVADTEDHKYMSDISKDHKQSASIASENVDETSTAPSFDAMPETEQDAKQHAGRDADRTSAASVSGGARRGGISPLLAGFAGGVAVLALAVALQWSGILPEFSTTAPVGSYGELANIEEDIGKLKTGITSGASSVESLDQRLTALREDLDALSKSVTELQAGLAAVDIPELTQSMAGFEQQKSELVQEIQKAQDTLQNVAGADPALSARIATVEEQVARLATVDTSDNLARLNTAVETSTQAEKGLVALSSQMATIASRLDALETSTAKLDEGPKLALVVAATALRGAIEAGRPFAGELQTYLALAGASPQLDPILPWAEKGIPDDAAIAAQSSEIADHVARMENPADPSQGLVNRLMSSASNLVKIRPVGEIQGDEPGQIAARLEAAAKRGDVAAALAEFENLPEATRMEYKSFADSLHARIAASEIVRASLSQELTP